jgi:hypothetical protein
MFKLAICLFAQQFVHHYTFIINKSFIFNFMDICILIDILIILLLLQQKQNSHGSYSDLIYNIIYFL